MSQKIVGMLSSYQGLGDQADWLWKQTPHHFGVWGNLQMLAKAEQPDFCSCINIILRARQSLKPYLGGNAGAISQKLPHRHFRL